MYRFADNQFDTTVTVVRKIADPELGFCLTKITRIFALFVQVSAATHNHASNATCTTTCCSVQSDLSEQHAPSLLPDRSTTQHVFALSVPSVMPSFVQNTVVSRIVW